MGSNRPFEAAQGLADALSLAARISDTMPEEKRRHVFTVIIDVICEIVEPIASDPDPAWRELLDPLKVALQPFSDTSDSIHDIQSLGIINEVNKLVCQAGNVADIVSSALRSVNPVPDFHDSSSPVDGSSGTPHPTGGEASWFGNDFPCCADGKNCLARLKEARQ